MPDASTVCGQLEQMTGWLKSRTPFVHLRFNDGEWQHGLHLVDYGTRLGNNHETHCQELERTILETIEGAISAHLNGERVLLGSYLASHQRDPGCMMHGKGDVPTILAYLNSMGWGSDMIHWGPPDLFYSTEFEKELEQTGGRPTGEMDLLFGLLGAIKGHDSVAMLVGPQMLNVARYCLEAEMVMVPLSNSFNAAAQVMLACDAHASRNPDAVFVWCAGVAGKTWAWRIWREFPQTSHIDAGCLFDPACGWRSRDWMLREDGPHWLEYKGRFIPLVLGKREAE